MTENRKRWRLLVSLWVVIIFFILGPASCAAFAQEPAFTLTGGVEAWSQWLGANAEIWQDTPVVQPWVGVDHSSGLYVYGWSSYTPECDSYRTCWGDETDFVVGFANDHVDVGVGYVFLQREAEGDAGWVFAKFATPKYVDGRWSLSAYVRGDYYWPITGEQDWIEGWNVHTGVELERAGNVWTSTTVLDLVHDTGAFDVDVGTSWVFDQRLTREVRGITAGLAMRASRGIDVFDPDDTRSDLNVAFGLVVEF